MCHLKPSLALLRAEVSQLEKLLAAAGGQGAACGAGGWRVLQVLHRGVRVFVAYILPSELRVAIPER
eukprot:15380984-Alexandrium_andersonii.AAC.1